MKPDFPSTVPRNRPSGSIHAIRFGWKPPAGVPSSGIAAFLFADPKFLDQLPVPLRIPVLEIVQEASAGSDHLEQTAAGMMIFGVRVEVPGQILDPMAQYGDLDLRRTRVRWMDPVRVDDLRLRIFRQRHTSSRVPIREPAETHDRTGTLAYVPEAVKPRPSHRTRSA